VAGAHIAEMIEAATGINLWAEWAKIETRTDATTYEPSKPRKDYAGLIVSLAKQETPDLSGYNDPEVYWTLTDKKSHAGIIVRSPNYDRITELLNAYTERFYQDFFTSLPATEKATE
jgi:hypothetical protein